MSSKSKVSVAAASFSIYAFNSLTEVMGGFLQVSDVESRSYVPFNEFDKVESNICMDFRLKVFHSVATNLSFTKASKELFISQPLSVNIFMNWRCNIKHRCLIVWEVVLG